MCIYVKVYGDLYKYNAQNIMIKDGTYSIVFYFAIS